MMRQNNSRTYCGHHSVPDRIKSSKWGKKEKTFGYARSGTAEAARAEQFRDQLGELRQVFAPLKPLLRLLDDQLDAHTI